MRKSQRFAVAALTENSLAISRETSQQHKRRTTQLVFSDRERERRKRREVELNKKYFSKKRKKNIIDRVKRP
jgi:hypothetical protein